MASKYDLKITVQIVNKITLVNTILLPICSLHRDLWDEQFGLPFVALWAPKMQYWGLWWGWRSCGSCSLVIFILSHFGGPNQIPRAEYLSHLCSFISENVPNFLDSLWFKYQILNIGQIISVGKRKLRNGKLLSSEMTGYQNGELTFSIFFWRGFGL